MTKLLQNKTIIKFLGIALSILLIVALVPQINIAYGSKDDVATDTPTAETGDNAATEGEEGEEGEESGEDNSSAEGAKLSDTDEATITATLLADEVAPTPAKTRSAVKRRAVNLPGGSEITNNNNQVNESDKVLTFNGGEHTLTVKGTLERNIVVKGGAVLSIKGAGTIKGIGSGSVIVVEGENSKLIVLKETNNEGITVEPTITNGKGTVYSEQEDKKVGGGIFVKNKAALLLEGGKIYKNEAQAGGGIYVAANAKFTMNGGEIDSNTATDSEGGGIFCYSRKDYEGNDYAKINGGKIINNVTNTTFSWGGGGVFVNTDGALRISSASITNNKAKGLGGGVSGCPHATIAVTSVANGAAIFKNSAEGSQYPTNPRLRLLDTNSVDQKNNGKKVSVATGDFLFDGLQKADIANEQETGRWSGFNAEEKPTSVFAKYGDYAKQNDIKQYAQDYYCTRASYIAPTSLGEKGVAWKGIKAGIPAVNYKSTISTENVVSEKVSIPIAKNASDKKASYSAIDASLGLTSEAEVDPYSATRAVEISGNTSGTHGGGVAANGVLEFGEYDWSSKVIESSYELELQKSIVNNLGVEIAGADKDFAPEERFVFTLTEKDGQIAQREAISDAKGQILFPGLPGLGADDFKNGETSTKKTIYFTLKEKNNNYTDKYENFTPKEIAVELEGEKKTTSFITGSTVMHTSTVYETTVKSVSINNDNTRVVTNTLKLEASENIPVKKITHGIDEGSFEFALNDVTDSIGNLIDVNMGTVKSGQDIAAKARKGTNRITYTFAELDDQNKAFKFTYNKKADLKSHWYAIAEVPGKQKDVSYDGTAYLVKVDVAVAEDGRSLNKTKTVYKVTPGSTKLEKVDGNIGVTFTNVKMKYAPFNLALNKLNKQVVTTLSNQIVGWNDLSDVNKKFHFSVYDPINNEVIFEGENEGNDIDLKVVSGKVSVVEGYVKAAYQEYLQNQEETFEYTIDNLKLKEEMPAEVDKDEHMTLIEDADVVIKIGIESAKRENDNTVFVVTPVVKSITLNGNRVEGTTVKNLYEPHGDWILTADKHFQGLGAPAEAGYTFLMSELDVASDDAIKSAQSLADLDKKKDAEGKELTWNGKTGAFNKNEEGSYDAKITFDPVSYVVKQGDTFDPMNGENHYYLVTENAPEGVSVDTTAFVVKVNVKQSADNKTVLEAKEVARWYADDIDQGIVGPIDKVEFYNTDTYDMISAASYSVYAASGEPVDQVCYVDPKIIKNLEGRAIKSGEFAFKLIQVANYTDTEGIEISAATNDEFGMVDFDKANNKGTLENPTCLAYTDPGPYYYRVIEDTSKGGMKDQSVLYSDQVITFTTFIEKDKTTGKLECTKMYYGYWDKAANKNVPFKEQYTDNATQPGDKDAMAKLNPDWHPTITNKARPMDLQVRKTSVTDRDEGLVGATYALYMVNDNVQGDIWLAEATSEEGGWITYKNVSLSTNNLYYFKETAAPAGHTVSEFRSPYFYLVEDATSPNGYALKYSDTKYFDAANAQADAATQAETTEPLAEVQAVALQNNAAAQAEAAETAAAQAEAAAADDTVQPGHSADGNILLTYDKDGGVYDEATQLEVNKLDTRTHEWVEGAKLVIVEKDSGKEVNSWTSGKAPEKLEKTLNVGTTYLLREVEAPGQYRLAEDVEFVIDNYGNVSITKGTENGNAELSDNTITLYDTMMDAEEVQRRNRETTREVPIGARLAQTGDLIPLAAIGLIVLVSLIALAVAARRRRSEKDSDN